MKITAWVLALLCLAWCGYDVAVDYRTIYTCLLCRAEKTNHKTLGWGWESERDTSFTGWYESHSGPHAHLWTRCSCTRGSNLFGRPTRWACGENHPLGLMQPEYERQFAERADPATWKAFLDGVLSPDRADQKRTVDAAYNWMLAQP